MQIVEVLYDENPSIDSDSIAARIADITGGATRGVETDNTAMFFHDGYTTLYDEGHLPAQTVLLSSDEGFSPLGYEASVQQSHVTENAAALLEGVTHSFLLNEMMARSLDPSARAEIFHATLQALVEHTRPKALVFMHSQQIIDPARYLESCERRIEERLGFLNVRFFSDSENSFVMDTRGLDELGLHDLQCHFQNLSPDDVARMLYNIAYYIFEQGPVIEDGNTVEGTIPGSAWVCQFEQALVEPERDILDINPGAEYAAGNRG